MRISDFIQAVINDLTANATFLKDVGTHGKVFGLEELQQLVLQAPACRIALVGSRGGSTMANRRDAMGRADNGQFRGPLQMIAFLIEQDDNVTGEEARDKVIKLADTFMYYLEHRTFGLSHTQAGPALITGFEILYSAEIDAQGAAIAAITWEQEVFFGRDIHREDMALLTGDEDGQYPSGQVFYPEGEWADKGHLDVQTPPFVTGTVNPMFSGEGALDTLVHDQLPPIEDDDG